MEFVKAVWRSLTHRLKISLMCLPVLVNLSGCIGEPRRDPQGRQLTSRESYVQRRIDECRRLQEIAGCDVQEIHIRPGHFGTVVECRADCGGER